VTDIRTLLFANAVVFAVLAVAMILVWRANRTVPGLSSLARVHVAMLAGAVLIGLKPGPLPALLLVVGGNGLVVLGTLWLLRGLRALYGEPRETWPWVAVFLWALALLTFWFLQPSLRARILTTVAVLVLLLARATWTVRRGLSRPEERAPSWLLMGSLGLLAAVNAARCIDVATTTRAMTPVGDDPLTLTLMIVSLMAGTGWTLGVMHLVYVRLNARARHSHVEIARRDAALQQLVEVAAHELRTPLTSILGSLKMLSAPAAALSSADRDHLLDVAQRNSERMSRLVNDLLDLERIASGQAPLDIETVDLGQLLQQARELTEGQAHKRHVAIEVSLPSPAQVQADAQRLLQVVVNLLSNAVKFSPPGQRVRLSVSCTERVVRVEVRDHGAGVPLELRPRIFERFARGQPPGVETGSGLGLAISKALIESMGGRIGFACEEKAGTTFYFELPAQAA
jgi:signal transduction histidine kinase